MLATKEGVDAEILGARIVIITLRECPLAERMNRITRALIRSAVIVVIAVDVVKALVLAAAIVERGETACAQAILRVTAGVPAKLLKGISDDGAGRVDRAATDGRIAEEVVAQIASGASHIAHFTAATIQCIGRALVHRIFAVGWGHALTALAETTAFRWVTESGVNGAADSSDDVVMLLVPPIIMMAVVVVFGFTAEEIKELVESSNVETNAEEIEIRPVGFNVLSNILDLSLALRVIARMTI